MTFIEFATNNLRRSKTRTILTILSVTVATATLIVVLSLNRGYKFAVMEELVKNSGVHLYITKEGCPMEASSVIAQGGISPLYVPEDVINKIKEVPNIEAMMPFNIFALTTEDGSRTDIFMGITEEIKKVRPEWEIVKGGWFKGENTIILGAEIARLEKREIGDKIYFEQIDKEFEVCGILKRNYTPDDGTFFLPLKTAQKLIDREGKLSAVAIKLKDIMYLEQTRNVIRSMLPQDYYVIASKELGEGVLRFFGSTKAVMIVMVVVAFVISIFSLMNTMLMTITERKKELAYLKCVGAGFTDIVKLIALEALIICVLGCVLGVIFGVFSTPWFESFIRKFLVVYVPSAKIVRFELGILLWSLIIVLTTGIFSAVYPAVKAAKIVPMEVLRNE
ncbi:MAG: ABC transporter permease [Elusimicrobiota bacterium]|nr:ABC transporter permease [Elusimicrobiota bacterium]